VETRIKYVGRIANYGTKECVVRIDRVTEAAVSGEFIAAERLLVLASGGDQRESVVEELSDEVWSDQYEYDSFDIAYIAARLALDLPFSWTGPDDSRIRRALIQPAAQLDPPPTDN
jgi:hypothetical protein